MKKSNYLNYLNEYNDQNVPIQVQKTFKNLKKNVKAKTKKLSKNKDCYIKPLNVPYLSIPKRTQNKENIHPNFLLQSIKNDTYMKKSQSLIIKPQRNIQPSQKYQLKENIRQMPQKSQKSKNIQVCLTKCNFQPSHQSENLYLVQTQTSKQIIVCQKCSQMFSKRIKISDFKKTSNQQHSYSDLVSLYEFYQQENKKLRRIQFIQKQSLHKNLSKVSSYYGSLIEKLKDLQNEVQKSIFEVYEKNAQILNQFMQKNVKNLRILDQRIQFMEKRCIDNVLIEKYETEKLQQIPFPKTQNQKIELCSFDIHLPQQIIERFERQFQESKFCIKLKNDRISQQEQNQTEENLQNIRFEQIKQIQEQHEQQQQFKVIEYNQSPDFEKELPFKVDFSITESKQANNFSHKMDELLSKVSSTQQLLIQSLREHRNYHQIAPIMMMKTQRTEEMKDSGNNLYNFKTQASTYRPQAQEKEESKQTKKNFIKELHNLQSNEIDDMLCDEDLTLSYSHPIYENNPVQPRKSLKLTKKGSKNNLALTLSQLQSQIGQQQRRNSVLKSQITNPSIITASQNKQDISFQLDENLIIDGNILPQESDGYQNLDIISPAFKII